MRHYRHQRESGWWAVELWMSPEWRADEASVRDGIRRLVDLDESEDDCVIAALAGAGRLKRSAARGPDGDRQARRWRRLAASSVVGRTAASRSAFGGRTSQVSPGPALIDSSRPGCGTATTSTSRRGRWGTA
jgi:hypothetical protein